MKIKNGEYYLITVPDDRVNTPIWYFCKVENKKFIIKNTNINDSMFNALGNLFGTIHPWGLSGLKDVLEKIEENGWELDKISNPSEIFERLL